MASSEVGAEEIAFKKPIVSFSNNNKKSSNLTIKSLFYNRVQ